ncbi:MAG: hypothetical protein KDI30_06525, partial [Pseudomonadales bacterium]|nr:hypothetical protein [Pseudomonadales bacterium]
MAANDAENMSRVLEELETLKSRILILENELKEARSTGKPEPLAAQADANKTHESGSGWLERIYFGGAIEMEG